jgi:hypothetical protein
MGKPGMPVGDWLWLWQVWPYMSDPPDAFPLHKVDDESRSRLIQCIWMIFLSSTCQ